MRILIAEDNQKLAASLKRGLEQEGYAVDIRYDGEAAERAILIGQGEYDLVILDLDLPKKTGISVCVDVRRAGVSTPVLMLTAQDTISDRVAGLDSGADDYLPKPFAFEELLSRIRAVTRRPRAVQPPEFSIGPLVLRSNAHEAYAGGTKLDLTLKEFRILEFFMQHPDDVLSRQTLADHLWDYSFNPFSRTLDVHIKNLRRKLEEHGHGSTIETVRGVGYRLAA